MKDSQNPPETHPKSFQNRCLRKHTIFHRFLRDFCCLLQEPTSKKRAPTQCFVNFSHNSVYRFEHTFSVQKTYQKPFQNEVRTLLKSIAKTCCFSTSIFSGLGLDFQGSGASKLEPSWTSWASRTLPKASKIQSSGEMCPRCCPREPKMGSKRPLASILD